MLTYCSVNLRNKIRRHFNQNANIFFREIVFGNAVWKISVILVSVCYHAYRAKTFRSGIKLMLYIFVEI